jgi:hypothetical protein
MERTVGKVGGSRRTHHDVKRSSSQIAQPFRPIDCKQATDEVFGVGVKGRREGDVGSEDLFVDV